MIGVVLAIAAAMYVAIAPSCKSIEPIDPDNPDLTTGTERGDDGEVIGATEPGDPVAGLPAEPARLPKRQRVEIDGHTFELELALNDNDRMQGLSDRRSIDPDGGMLFVHPRARVLSFVMRRCHVPIDIIYLDESGVVVKMYQMQVVEPIGSDAWYYRRDNGFRRVTPSYSSGKYAQLVIELRGGTLDDLDISEGDRIDLPLDTLMWQAQ